MTRWLSRWGRALLFAAVPVGMSLTLVSTSAARAGADVPIVPIIVGGAEAGGETTTGVAVAGGATAPGSAGIALIAAGLGAYDGTCYLLHKIFPAGSCGTPATQAVYHLLTGSLWTPGGEAGAPATVGQCTAYVGSPATKRNAFLMCNGWPTNANVLDFPWPGSGNGNAYLGNLGGGRWGYSESLCAALAPSDLPCFSDDTVSTTDTFADGNVYWRHDSSYLGSGPDMTGNKLVQVGLQAHTATVTETCTSPDGSTFTENGSVTWTPTPGGASPDITMPACWSVTPGAVQTHIGTTITVPGHTVGTIQQDTIDHTRFPLCAMAKCWLTPEYVPTTTKCFGSATDTSAAGDCVDQWPNEKTNPGSWRCWYGSYRVPLSECEDAYPRTYFSAGTSSLTDPWNPPAPSGEPSSSSLPTTGGNPTSAPTDTTTDPEPPGMPQPNPEGQNCWSSGWSWNPVSWVYVPIKCAFLWAAIPPAMPSFTSSMDGTHVPDWLAAFTGFGGSGSPGGCAGPDLSIPAGPVGGTDGLDVHPFDSCTGSPMHDVATKVRFAALVLMNVYLAWNVIGRLLAAFGVEKVTPAGQYSTDETPLF